MPKLKEILFGSSDKVKQYNTQDPMQQQLMALINEGLTNSTGAFKDLFGDFNQEEFQKGVADPALKNFKDNVLPLILEKFVSGNSVGGSAMNRAVVKGGTDLQSKIAELMYGAQQDQKKMKFEGLKTATGTQTVENIMHPGKGGVVQAFAQGAGQGMGNSAGSFVAG